MILEQKNDRTNAIELIYIIELSDHKVVEMKDQLETPLSPSPYKFKVNQNGFFVIFPIVAFFRIV